MLLALFTAPVFAGDYDVTLRVDARRGRTIVEQGRAIADSIPRAIPFIWKREPASALLTTRLFLRVAFFDVSLLPDFAAP